MFGDAILLDDIHVMWILSGSKSLTPTAPRGLLPTKMGTARLYAYNLDGSPTYAEIQDVLYSPSLPANLISVTQLYDNGIQNHRSAQG